VVGVEAKAKGEVVGGIGFVDDVVWGGRTKKRKRLSRRKFEAGEEEAVECKMKRESVRGVSSKEGRRCTDNFPLNRGNRDVVEVAVRSRNGGGRLRMPEGGDGSCVVVEEKNIEAANEWLGNWRRCGGRWRSEVEMKDAENLEGVVNLNAGDAVGQVDGRGGDVDAYPIGLGEAFGGVDNVEGDISTVNREVVDVEGYLQKKVK
jgi:hypothetical protein